MTTHVALLRGINVGKAKRVAMADLRRTLERLGFEDVRTLLNSGNVVFEAPAKGAPGPRIEAAVARELGVESRVTVLTADRLAALLAANPLAASKTDAARLLVVFLASRTDAQLLAPLARRDFGRERIVLGQGAAYLACPDGVLGGQLWGAVERALGGRGTTRNLATLAKLLALAR